MISLVNTPTEEGYQIMFTNLHRLNKYNTVNIPADSKDISIDLKFPPSNLLIQETFHYDSDLWSNKDTFNPGGGETGFDHNEPKLPTD